MREKKWKIKHTRYAHNQVTEHPPRLDHHFIDTDVYTRTHTHACIMLLYSN